MHNLLTRYNWRIVSLIIALALFLRMEGTTHAQDQASIDELELNWDHTETEANLPEAIDWNSWDVIPGRVLIKYTPLKGSKLRNQVNASGVDGLSIQPIETWAEQAFAAQRESSAGFRPLLPYTFIGKFEPSERDRILSVLQSDLNVIYVEPERWRVSAVTWGTDTPNDPLLRGLWGMTRIGAPNAWRNLSATRSSIRVAVMENQFESTHPDLSGQVASVISNTLPITDHATHVAGTIAATGNNNLGVVGVANVELVSLGWGDTNISRVNYISWANNNSIRIVNMSFKDCGNDGINNGNDCNKCLNPERSATEQDAISNSSILFVASAGNDACNLDAGARSQLPVSYNNVIGVSAINITDTRASFSNFGGYVDITAPGVGISSTVMGGIYDSYNGTSMAAPHVAGAAAAVLSVKSNFSRPSLTRLLQLTAQDIGDAGRDDDFGAGVVRVDRAVDGVADVYVDNTSYGTLLGCLLRTGSLALPYCSLNTALTNVPTGGKVGLVRGSWFNTSYSLTKPMTLKAVGGTVLIGPSSIPLSNQSSKGVLADTPSLVVEAEATGQHIFLPLILDNGRID